MSYDWKTYILFQIPWFELFKHYLSRQNSNLSHSEGEQTSDSYSKGVDCIKEFRKQEEGNYTLISWCPCLIKLNWLGSHYNLWYSPSLTNTTETKPQVLATTSQSLLFHFHTYTMIFQVLSTLKAFLGSYEENIYIYIYIYI